MNQTGTYQTRTADYAGLDRWAGDAVLAAYGELYGRVQRKLFAEVAAGRFNHVAEERVPEAAWDTGADVQRGAGVPGWQVGVGQRAAETAAGRTCNGGLHGLRSRSPMPPDMVGLIRFIRRNGGWPICGTGCLHWKLT